MSRFVAIAAALIACNPSHKPPPAPRDARVVAARPTARPADAGTDANRAIFAAAEFASLQDVSADGMHALVGVLPPDSHPFDHKPWRMVIVNVATGAIEGDESFVALGAVSEAALRHEEGETYDADALADELKRIEAFEAGFEGKSVSVSADGSHIAYGVGDSTFTFANNRLVTHLPGSAAYGAFYSHDGKELFYDGYNGHFSNEEARYQLFVTSADGKARPRAIPGTEGFNFVFEAPDGMRALVTREPLVQTCVMAIAAAPPHKATKLACLDGKEPTMECVASKKGTYAACATVSGPEETPVFRQRVFDTTTGKVLTDRHGLGGIEALSDDGTLVLTMAEDLIAVRPGGSETTYAVQHAIGMGPLFRNDHELVTIRDRGVYVFDITK